MSTLCCLIFLAKNNDIGSSKDRKPYSTTFIYQNMREANTFCDCSVIPVYVLSYMFFFMPRKKNPYKSKDGRPLETGTYQHLMDIYGGCAMFLKKSISKGKVYLSFVQGYRKDVAKERNRNLEATRSIEILLNQRLRGKHKDVLSASFNQRLTIIRRRGCRQHFQFKVTLNVNYKQLPKQLGKKSQQYNYFGEE